MKVETTTSIQEQEFKPFTVSVTFESLGEAYALLHMLNGASPEDYPRKISGLRVVDQDFQNGWYIWKAIRHELQVQRFYPDPPKNFSVS